MVVTTRLILSIATVSVAIAQKRFGGHQGECFGPRFHNVTYEMSEEKDEDTGYPADFNVNVQPNPDWDHLCPAANGGGTKKGVCVGVNTNDCHTGRRALKIDEFLSCENCFLGLSTDINYEIDVKWFKLQKASLGLQNTHLIGALEFLAHQAASKTVADGTFPIIGEDLNYQINFLVAGVVPINIKFSVPTELTYKVTLSESVELRFGGDVDLDLGDHAIEWTSGSGWSAPSTAGSATFTPVLEAKGKVQADMPIGLKSTLKIDFEKVLEYDISFAPSLPLHAELDLDTSGADQICLSSGADFEIDHEARLHFDLFGKDLTVADWGPGTLWSHHWDKVFDKCWALSGDESETTPAPTSAPPTSEPITTFTTTALPETTVSPTSEPETTVAPTSEPETTVAPTTHPETTVPSTTEPETPQPPTTVPETSAAPTSAATTTLAPTTALPLPLSVCKVCLTMCAPCRECVDGPAGSFMYGSCDKCWHCWDWDDDELEDSDKHMDKDCDAMHKDHDWDDDEVRCLTDQVQFDCRQCWQSFASEMLV